MSYGSIIVISKNKVIKATFWSGFANVSGEIVNFAVTVVLARLLNPTDFGIVAISYIFISLVELFRDLGMGQAIIQRKNVDDSYLSTSFIVTIIAGISFAGAMCLASQIISEFFDSDILINVLKLSSMGYILSSITTTHMILLTKSLRFDKLALINFMMHLTSGISSIILALYNFGVWSLVFGKLIGQFISIPLTWHIVRWRPRLIFEKKCFKDLWSFSSNILIFNMVNFLSRNLDRLIIGKYLGANILGYYSIANKLMLKPLVTITRPIGVVLFPVFSSIQNDVERIRESYLKVIRSTSIISFPMMVGLMIVSEEFIITLYGEKWAPAILPLRLLCLVGAFQSVYTINGTIYNSMGRSDIFLKTGIFTFMVVASGFMIGIRWGLNGLIIGYIIAMVPVFIYTQRYINRLINIKYIELFRSILPAVLSTFIMATSLIIIKQIVHSSEMINFQVSLFIYVFVGIFIYMVVIFKIIKTPETDSLARYVRNKVTEVFL